MDGTPVTESHGHRHHQAFWLWVMCLTGVDYFSTLGYQPSIAFETTGQLAPLATLVLVMVTLFGALPVYCFVAGQSPHGQGSIGMLERLVSGWGGKAIILILLGFAATDFVITKTLSAADAAKHVISNKAIWPTAAIGLAPDKQQLLLTMFLLLLLGAVFIKGFREVIGIAVFIVGVYLVLNLMILFVCFEYLAEHPENVVEWWSHVTSGQPEQWHIDPSEMPIQTAAGGTLILIAVCLLVFPKLALGLSGFETGVAVMAHIRGASGDTHEHPTGRIRNTRKLLVTAAVIMSIYLIGSSIIVATLIPPEAFAKHADPT